MVIKNIIAMELNHPDPVCLLGFKTSSIKRMAFSKYLYVSSIYFYISALAVKNLPFLTITLLAHFGLQLGK